MEFNHEQAAALSSSARNLLVLAGAGTGKTRTIIGRARHLLKQGVPPERIVIMTFTRRAANEIRSRLAESAGSDASRVVAGTFHHFCLRSMSARRQWFGFEDLSVIDRDDQLQLMKLSRGQIVNKNSMAPKAAELLSYYSYARNTNQPPRAYLEKFTEHQTPAIDVMLKIFDAYKQRKRDGSYFDYDDIIHRFAKVMHESTEVRRKIAGSYDHVLVDEMQDTNPLQWLILQSLSEYTHLFCVGDDAQSIYAFRGADFRNVHSFEQRLEGAQTLKLQQNYRSTQEILDLANWLLDQSRLDYGKRLEAVRGAGQQPSLIEFSNEYEEAEWVVSSIVERQRQGDRWDDCMVLCRSAFVARPVEAQLIERKVPYRFVGGISLLQMAHVKDLLSALRVAVNVKDELAWMRFLTLWPGIGEVTAARALQLYTQCDSIESALEQLPSLPRFRQEIGSGLSVAASHRDDPSKAVVSLIKVLEPILEAKYDRWESRKRDLKLIEQLATKHRSVAAFLETYTLDPLNASEVEREDDDDLVTLITVHSAKGTESKHCYVVGAQQGNYPHSRSQTDDAIEEERRVLYVALTRAQDTLIITRNLARSYSRAPWGQSNSNQYFLEHLPAALVRSQTLFGNVAAYDTDEDFIG